MSEAFEVHVSGKTPAESQVLARELIASLRFVSPDVEVERKKDSSETMDVGAVLSIVVGSGAALALARGIATWLAKRQSAKITITKDGAIVAENITSQHGLDIVKAAVATREQ